eukprot:6492763-Amphidinium_carterae.2
MNSFNTLDEVFKLPGTRPAHCKPVPWHKQLRYKSRCPLKGFRNSNRSTETTLLNLKVVAEDAGGRG